jgi:hypothetical protein
MLGDDDVGDTLIVANVMKALDAEFLDEGTADYMSLGTELIRRRYPVVIGDDDTIGVGDMLDVPPIGWKEVTIIKHDRVDIDYDKVARLRRLTPTGFRQNLFHDGHSHGQHAFRPVIFFRASPDPIFVS